MPIDAAIFDMDGLLVDSEPLWTEAEIEVFGTVGLDLDEARCAETVGLGIREVVAVRFAERPWTTKSQEQVAEEIHELVVSLLRSKGRPMPGAVEAVGLAASEGARLGVASSSAPEILEAALDAIGLRGAFEHVQSGYDLPFRKPHPEVYLVTAERLGVPPARCAAFEDSLPGVIAGKAASMTTVAVPERRLRGDPRFSIADLVLSSLEELDGAAWEGLG